MKQNISFTVSNAEYSVPSSSKASVETEKWKRDITSLKVVANDSNFAEIAATIDYEEIRNRIDSANDFVTLENEPKIYDVLAFKVIDIRFGF